MRLSMRCIPGLLIAACTGAFAQQWELGGAAGFGFPRTLSVTNQDLKGKAGFSKGAAFSAVGGQHLYRYLSGELRYVYRDSDLRVTSGGTKVKFAGDSHIVHYDALIHPPAEDWRIQPFLAFGGGVRVFRGTGRETEYQDLDRLAILTKTDELKPVFSLGGGFRFRLNDSMLLRVDFRDYMSPFPTQVVLPAPGATMKGWVHDFTPMIGISAFF
ncbi:MAG: outer membrane beta-barrel protein [Bryobacterales bacterium]|nr:outer membrane beta-barrel protein [Bryobacterales bacterium]